MTAPSPWLRRELVGLPLWIGRAAVVGFAIPFMFAFARWVGRWVEMRDRDVGAFGDATGLLHWAVAASVALALLAVLVWWSLAVLVFARRSRDGLGLLLALAFFCFGPCLTDPSTYSRIARADDWAFVAPILLAANIFVMPWLFVFPDGVLIPRWGILVAIVWAGWYIIRMFVPEADPHGLWSLVSAGLGLTGISAPVYRYLKRSDVVQRQQLKWALLAGVLFTVPWLLVGTLPRAIPSLGEGADGFLYRTVTASLYAIAQITVPIALGIAIFRQGLLNVDFLVSRALAYGALTAILVGSFAVVSALAGRAFGSVPGVGTELLSAATALILALAFAPLRSLLIGLADRFMSGRRVATVLFVDIVGSTSLAVTVGDHEWRRRLEHFLVVARKTLERYGGEEVDTAGDGLFATFSGPGRAIRCAVAITQAVRAIGLDVRSGLHIGEVEVFGDKVTGVAVHIGARILALAEPGEVLVSGAVRDLVAGSNIEVRDRGEHELKGVPGRSRVYAVVAS